MKATQSSGEKDGSTERVGKYSRGAEENLLCLRIRKGSRLETQGMNRAGQSSWWTSWSSGSLGKGKVCRMYDLDTVSLDTISGHASASILSSLEICTST